jgi:hypothetical protein
MLITHRLKNIAMMLMLLKVVKHIRLSSMNSLVGKWNIEKSTYPTGNLLRFSNEVFVSYW